VFLFLKEAHELQASSFGKSFQLVTSNGIYNLTCARQWVQKKKETERESFGKSFEHVTSKGIGCTCARQYIQRERKRQRERVCEKETERESV